MLCSLRLRKVFDNTMLLTVFGSKRRRGGGRSDRKIEKTA
jgi:hypothetical protein